MSQSVRGFVYEPRRGPQRKVEYVERETAVERVESVWTGCAWRVVGREVVASVRRIYSPTGLSSLTTHPD